MKKIVLLWGVILGCCACMDLPADVEEALALAGGNRRELKAVLRHYRQDSLKFRAACFLIANMRWHYSDDSGYCLYSDAKDSDLCDLRRFDRLFLISHVDHAFDVWESSPCAQDFLSANFASIFCPTEVWQDIRIVFPGRNCMICSESMPVQGKRIRWQVT